MEEAIKKATEEQVTKRYTEMIRLLEESVQKARLCNDKLSQQLFILSNRTINVTEKIGFPDFEEFEEAVLDDPEMWNVHSIKANHARALSSGAPHDPMKDSSRDGPPPLEGFREEFEKLKYQVHVLQQRSITKPSELHTAVSVGRSVLVRSPLSPLKLVENSSPSEEPKLRAEIDILSRKYDALLAAKESAEKKYKEDYKKWKHFKAWLFNKSKHAKALRAQLAEENFDLRYEFQEDIDDRDSKSTPTPMRQCSETSRSSNGENLSLLPTHLHPSRTAPDPRARSTRREPMSDSGMGFGSRLTETPAFPSTSTSPTFRKRKAHRSEPPKLLESKVMEDIGKTDSISPEVSSALTKGKGRYAVTATAGEAINALYTIDTSRNNGLAFQYDEVIRGKEHRHRLEAGDCDCCKEYYDSVAPLPSRLAPPLWLSSPTTDTRGNAHPDLNEPDDEATASHRKRISRHRHQWSPAKTPPDYWNIGFPTTQEAANINRKAAEMHADKRRRVEREAKMVGGKYIKRQDKLE